MWLNIDKEMGCPSLNTVGRGGGRFYKALLSTLLVALLLTVQAHNFLQHNTARHWAEIVQRLE